jgi:hypothetical protein
MEVDSHLEHSCKIFNIHTQYFQDVRYIVFNKVKNTIHVLVLISLLFSFIPFDIGQSRATKA